MSRPFIIAVDFPRTAGCSLSLIYQWDSNPLTRKSRLMRKFIKFSCLLWLVFDIAVESLVPMVFVYDLAAKPLANMDILRISHDSLLSDDPFNKLSKNFFLSIYYKMV